MGNRYLQYIQQQEKDKAGWVDPALSALGAAGGFMVGGPAGAMAGYQMGHGVGNAAESAANGVTDPMAYLRDFATARSGWDSIPVGFANGGPVPGGQMPWWVRAAMEQQQPPQAAQQVPDMAQGRQMLEQFAGPAPTPFQPREASHPTLEMLASIIPQVLQSMPKPVKPNNRAIGTWLPAIGTAIGAPAKYAQAKRQAYNEQGQAQYEAQVDARNKRMAAAAPSVAGYLTREVKEPAAGEARVPIMLSDWNYMMERNAIPQPIQDEFKAFNGTLSRPAYTAFQAAVDNLYSKDNAARVAGATSAAADERAAKTESAQEEVERIAADIASFQTEPDVPLNGRSAQFGAAVKNRVNEILRANGSPYNYQQLRTLWTEKQNFNKTQNNQRFVQLRQSAVTVRKHLEQFKEFYRKYSRIRPPRDIRVIGKTQFQLAMEGLLGKDAQRAASELASTSHAVAREAALVFTGGYAPMEDDVRSAQETLNVAAMSRGAGEGTIRSLERLLEARIKTAAEGTPFAGGRKNPYLMEASPMGGWDEGAPVEEKPASGVDGGGARQGYFPKDAKPAKERGR